MKHAYLITVTQLLLSKIAGPIILSPAYNAVFYKYCARINYFF